MWLEYANSAACALLLALTLPAATLADPRRNPVHCVGILCVAVAFFLQIVAPFTDWVPNALWPSTLLHVLLAGGAIAWRSAIWLFLRADLGELPVDHPIRRTEDVLELLADRRGHVSGAGAER